MPNAINNVKDVGTVIAKTAAAMLEDQIQFAKVIDQEPESTFGQVNGYNTGDTVNINKPARFIPTSTADITSTIQDVVEEKVSLVLDIRKIVGIKLTSAEIQNTLALKDWSKRVLSPAVSSIAHYVENDFLTKAKNQVYNLVGTAGSTVFDTDTILAAGQKIKEGLAPMDGEMYCLLNSGQMRSALNARKGLPNPSDALKKQYGKGQMFEADGFTYLENNLTATHANGADVSGMAVEASVVTIANGMSTLGVDGVASGATIKAGSVFTIAGVNAVHPITKQDLGYLQQFVVTADVTEASGNSVTLAISPSIYYTATDPRQNVSAAPVDETGTITWVGLASTTYGRGLAFHKSAFRFCSVPLMKPEGAHIVGQERVGGMTMRVWADGNVLTDTMTMRLDFLGAFKAVRPEWACQITS